MAGNGIVVVFDFDKTIIDCDSDNWVIDNLGATDLFNQLLLTLPWNTAMDKIMKELHSQGKTIDQIADILKRAPLIPRIISAIKSAHAFGCELRILSDANLFFIETILKHYDLLAYFSEINTNPGFVDEQGSLRISPFHDFTSCPHGCHLCPPNMCKGIVIQRIQAEAFAQGKKRFIYLGDGKGDYCPSLKLGEKDIVMPRKNYPLWELICLDRSLIKAEIHEWSGEDQEMILLHLVNKIIFDENKSESSIISPDWKFQSFPVSTHEPLPQVLPVPH